MNSENNPERSSFIAEEQRRSELLKNWVEGAISYDEFKALYLNRPDTIRFGDIFAALLDFLKLKK